MAGDSMFTFENLQTIGGASLLCFLIVAYTKGLLGSFAPWVPTNVYSLFVATVILILVQINVNPSALHVWQTYFLSVANGILVSATASHTNELATRFPTLTRKTKEKVTEIPKTETVEETGA
jgi:hypothetical protein